MQPNFSFADFTVWLEQSGTTVFSEKAQKKSFDDEASKLQQIFQGSFSKGDFVKLLQYSGSFDAAFQFVIDFLEANQNYNEEIQAEEDEEMKEENEPSDLTNEVVK